MKHDRRTRRDARFPILAATAGSTVLLPYNSAQRASTETINVPLLRLDYAHITSADCRVDRRGVRIKPLSRVAARVPPRKSCGRAVVARLKHELARVLPPVKARARQPRGFSCARLGSWPESLCKNEAANEEARRFSANRAIKARVSTRTYLALTMYWSTSRVSRAVPLYRRRTVSERLWASAVMNRSMSSSERSSKYYL